MTTTLESAQLKVKFKSSKERSIKKYILKGPIQLLASKFDCCLLRYRNVYLLIAFLLPLTVIVVVVVVDAVRV